MIRPLFTFLAFSHSARIAEVTRTVDPPGSTSSLSSMLRAVAEQLLSVSGPITVPEYLTRAIPEAVVRNVPSRGLAGEWEMTVLASSVDFGALVDFPDWTAQVFIYAGLCLLLLGLMAWLGSHRLQRRAWGRRLTLSGGGLFVVGSAWNTFLDLLRYVLG
jgi:hypothetical protein